MNEKHQKEKLALGTNSQEVSPLGQFKETGATGPNNSSSSSVKLRKSSNIFSVLVRKARKKSAKVSKPGEALKGLEGSSQNLSGISSISLISPVEEEVELNCQNYEKKCGVNQDMLWENRGICSETNTTNHSEGSSSKNPTFVHLKGSITSREHHESSQDQGQVVMTSFIYFEKPSLDVNHTDALQYLQEIVNTFYESEAHLISLLARYVADPTVQAEMRNVLSNHAKLQWEAERRSCLLANEIWAQQLEISRAQESNLQMTLNEAVKQNRQLQIESENLYRKCERACRLLKGYPDHKSHEGQLGSVLRHNEKLQSKLESLFKKMECLESELVIFQKQNNTMEEQLREYAAKMQNFKGVFHKMKTDYEIERISLSIQLESKERALQEATVVSDVTLKDLDGLKRQFTELNWTKITVRENCLADLIHLCRACITELAAELVKANTDAAIKEKDIVALRKELDAANDRLEVQSSIENEKKLLEQKCHFLEKRVETSEAEIEELKEQCELEKSKLVGNLAGTQKQLKELEDKDKMLEQTKLFIANITSENCSLHSEVAALNQLLSETGAGDMFRQIEQKHEEIDFYRRELEKVQKENINLKAQAEGAKQENAAIVANQEMAFNALQGQIKELERLNEDNLSVRQKLETEHNTVISLQAERVKYLEDRHMLKAIVQHLKNELAKIGRLEEDLSNVTGQASKLSLIAEYNKQQGEKLKEEIVHRDTIIAHLKEKVQEMGELHVQESREKLALCQELNEVSQVKEKLNDILNSEVKRNAELGQSKEAIVKTVNSQMQKIEEKHHHERIAIRTLLKDMKVVAEERDAALKEKYKLEIDIDQLKSKLSEQNEKSACLLKDMVIKSEEGKELRKELDRQEKLQKESKDKLDSESSKYDYNLRQLKKLIEQLRIDKKELQNGKDYLKNNIDKVQRDLDNTRQSEKLSSDQLRRAKQELEEVKASLKEQAKAAEDLQKEKEKVWEENVHLNKEKENLTKQIECLNALIEKVVNDFEQSLKTSEEKEGMFKQELDASKELICHYDQELRELKQSLDLKEKRISELSDLGSKELHDKQLKRLKDEMHQLELASAAVKAAKSDLEVNLSKLQEEHEKTLLHVTQLEKEVDVLESQLKIVLDQKEDDYLFYKKHIAEISRSHEDAEAKSEKEIAKLHSQLQDINHRLSNEKMAYETLSQIHKEVSGKFMKSIKELVEEKTAKQSVVEQVAVMKAKVEKTEKEKKHLCEEASALALKLENASKEILKLSEEKTGLKEKSFVLENQFKHAQINHHDPKVQKESFKLVDALESENQKLTLELEENIATIHRLNLEISDLQKQITLVQLERSDIALKLHETERKLETEKSFAEQLKNTQKLLLAAVMQLKEEGKVDPSDCIHLLHMVRSSSHLSLDVAKSDS